MACLDYSYKNIREKQSCFPTVLSCTLYKKKEKLVKGKPGIPLYSISVGEESREYGRVRETVARLQWRLAKSRSVVTVSRLDRDSIREKAAWKLERKGETGK